MTSLINVFDHNDDGITMASDIAERMSDEQLLTLQTDTIKRLAVVKAELMTFAQADKKCSLYRACENYVKLTDNLGTIEDVLSDRE